MAKTRILIVEDERIVAEDIKTTLEDLGYEVCGLMASGSEALARMDELRPDLILMDIVLKGELNGIEAAEKVRSELSIPIVYLTAYGDDATIKRAKLTEPYGYIMKPFNDRELCSVIETALYKHGVEQNLAHLNAVLRAICNVNQLITKETDRDRLLQGVCDNLIATLGYYNAWIALFDESGSITITANAGFNGAFAPMAERLARGELTPCGREALDQTGAVIVKDPPAECSDCPLIPLISDYSGRAGMSSGLGYGGKTYGLLTVSVPAQFSDNPEEQALFREVADDIAFALYKIELEERREVAERARVERVKELECLYGLAKIVQQEGIAPEELYQQVADMLPSSWRYPDITCARVVIGDREFRTKNFAESKWKQSADIKVGGATAGQLEIAYVEERPECDEGPFLREEKSLLDAVAERLARVVERQQAQEALREAEAKWRSLAQNAPDVIMTVMRDGTISFVNRVVPGLSLGEVLGKNVGDFMALEHADTAMSAIESVFRTGEPTSYEVSGTGPHGDIAHYSIRIGPIMLGDEVVAAVQISTDITERRRAEQVLRESEQRYRALIENTRDIAYSYDAEGKLTFLGPQAAHYGIDCEEAISRNLLEFVAPEDRERITDEMRRILATGEEFPTEFRIVGADGRTYWFEEHGACLRDATGEIVGMSGMLRDITERKQAEKEKAVLEEQFRQAQKMEAVGRLAGGIAHDFNNMLGVIIGYSDILLHDLREDDPIHRDVQHIRGAADRAAGLTRQLLAFSRKQVLELQVLDLNGIVSDLEKMLRRLIGEDIALSTVLQPDVGRVKADAGQIEQVIMNLAVNARDAMPEGGTLMIETADADLDEEYAKTHVSVIPGPYVMLAITDSGGGMDEDTRSKIFDPFFTTKEMGKGTGLGLSTVYGIVKQSGGNIWIYTELGKGTTFKIYLPRVEGAVEAAATPKGLEKSPRGSETVLVVEDEEVLRRLTTRILKLGGYKVLEAAHGGDALLVCRDFEGSIDLLVTDVVMPKMSGRKLANHLAEDRPDMKVLFMSGYTDNAIVHQGVLDEGAAFIQKPFTASALMQKVRDVLDAAKKDRGDKGAPE